VALELRWTIALCGREVLPFVGWLNRVEPLRILLSRLDRALWSVFLTSERGHGSPNTQWEVERELAVCAI